METIIMRVWKCDMETTSLGHPLFCIMVGCSQQACSIQFTGNPHNIGEDPPLPPFYCWSRLFECTRSVRYRMPIYRVGPLSLRMAQWPDLTQAFKQLNAEHTNEVSVPAVCGHLNEVEEPIRSLVHPTQSRNLPSCRLPNLQLPTVCHSYRQLEACTLAYCLDICPDYFTVTGHRFTRLSCSHSIDFTHPLKLLDHDGHDCKDTDVAPASVCSDGQTVFRFRSAPVAVDVPRFCRAVPPKLDPRLHEDLRTHEACRLPFSFGTPYRIHPVEAGFWSPPPGSPVVTFGFNIGSSSGELGLKNQSPL